MNIHQPPKGDKCFNTLTLVKLILHVYTLKNKRNVWFSDVFQGIERDYLTEIS